jgi:hypothetical protein
MEYKTIGFLFLLAGGCSFIGFFKRRHWLLNNSKKRFFLAVLINLCFFAFFIFYASFPLVNDALMATVERFYIIPLLFLTPFLALGLEAGEFFIRRFPKIQKLALILYQLIIIFLPIIIFLGNFYKILILKNDFTAEKLGRDILNSAPNESVLLVAADTPYFDTQYVHYALRERPDVLLINPILTNAIYRQKLTQAFPEADLTVSDPEEQYRDFIKHNMFKRPMYLNYNLSIENSTQIPEGLLLRYYPTDSTPSAETIYQKNLNLIKNFQDLSKSSLTKYQNLFLTDVKDSYIQAYLRLMNYFLDLNEYDKAESFAQKYTDLVGQNDSISLLAWGRIRLGQGQCQEAEKFFLKTKDKEPVSPLPDAFLRQVYLNCFKDENKAKQYLDSCFEKDTNQLPKL